MHISLIIGADSFLVPDLVFGYFVYSCRRNNQKPSLTPTALGYSLQANRKTFEGKGRPDRNAQFEHINAEVRAALKAGEPVISVDAKKKELVGDFKNAGREWQPKGQPEPVR